MSGHSIARSIDLRPAQASGPKGTRVGLEDLPPPETTRWVSRRKALVVTAVRGGLLTEAEACERWGLSAEELRSWERLMDQHGVRGLMVNRLQEYRAANRSTECKQRPEGSRRRPDRPADLK